MTTRNNSRQTCCNRRDFLRSAGWGMAILALSGAIGRAARSRKMAKRNIVFVLSDDHRYDFMGFMKEAPAFLETPNMDRMSKQGAHLANAFVSTSLCSPSRASILTGQYMHHHRIVEGHEHDSPRPGFDHWASFKGQGAYFDPTLNVNGKRKKFQGYTTDILTDQALAWLKDGRNTRQPFFLYLSFKAVHYPFQPAKRHQGRYAEAQVKRPETMANTERNYQTQPHWVRERRYSIHGIDHMETGQYDNDPVPSFDNLYRQYCETVHGLDENLGRVLNYLDKSGLSKSTLVIYMGDNGFALGEHGFYDKRDAFEESIRVPMLAYAPGMVKPDTKVTRMVQNIDIAPTLLDMAGVRIPKAANMDGRSFLPLLQGKSIPWRDHILYEYYWEWNFPATPTVFAIRTQRYKYIFYHGVWDHDGFYDLQTDPHERHNLINVPAYQEQIEMMKKQLFDELEAGGGLVIPARRPLGERLDQRKNKR
ncbi:MAG: sulfatase family protein [Planctomycetota bacterium]